ncbi:MAG: hypothetical protein V3W11_10340 [bacterium]
MIAVRSFFYGAALILVGAVPVFCSLGSVISSFRIADNYHTYAYGVARDGTYVYYVTVEMSPAYRLYYRYPGGGGGGMIFIGKFPAGHGDADTSVLGTGYFADIYEVGSVQTITDFDIRTGSAVASWAPFEGNMRGYAYSPALRRKYVARDYRIYRYDTSGNLLSSFGFGRNINGLAVTEEFCGYNGEYIIASYGTDSYVLNAQGVQIGSFSYPRGVITACACGPGYPSEYGTTFWCIVDTYMQAVYLSQVSLHNATAVTPASVGRIKALFR